MSQESLAGIPWAGRSTLTGCGTWFEVYDLGFRARPSYIKNGKLRRHNLISLPLSLVVTIKNKGIRCIVDLRGLGLSC